MTTQELRRAQRPAFRLPSPSAIGSLARVAIQAFVVFWTVTPSPAHATADAPSSFAYAATIQAAHGDALYRLRLPAVVYTHAAHADLRDLRVFNARGEAVPHALQPAESATGPETRTRVPVFPIPTVRNDNGVEGFRVEMRTGGAVIRVLGADSNAAARGFSWLADASGISRPFDHLDLELADSADSTLAHVDVRVSEDLKSWRTVAEAAPVVRTRVGTDSLQRLRIDTPGARGRYVLLIALPNGTPLPLKGVHAVLAPGKAAAPFESVAFDATGTDRDQASWEYDLGRALPAREVALSVPDGNVLLPVEIASRNDASAPWRPLATATAYSLRQGGVSYDSAPIPVSGSPARFFRVRLVSGKETMPREAPKLAIRWRSDDLVFAARGEPPFTLAFGKGDARDGAMPVASLIPGFGTPAALEPTPAAIGQIREHAGVAALKTPLPFGRWALWGLLGVGTAMLVSMAIRLARGAGAPPPKP